MDQQKPVKVIKVCLVEPPKGGAITSLPLTFFDVLWLRFLPVERLFIYDFPHPTSSFFDSVLPTLKHSLQLTLQHFLPLAGKITWPLHSPCPIINYVPGDAVSFTIAESNADFNLLCSNFCDAKERSPLIPHLETSHDQASVLALQLTLFPNSGFCIGITTHHAAMDGKSSTSFLKAWAYACSKLLIETSSSPSSSSSSLSSCLSSLLLPQHLAPYFDRSVIRNPSAGILQVYVNEVLKQGGPNNRSLKVLDSLNNRVLETDAVRGLFELTPSHIEKMKQYAQSSAKLKAKVVSTFSVTIAHLFSCLVKVEQPKANRVALIFAVDCRTRFDPPIPQAYFGNCLRSQYVAAETINLLGNDGFINALEGVIEALKAVEDNVMSWAENRVSTRESMKEHKLYSVTGSPRFDVYGVDFGWGRPNKVEITTTDKTGSFSLAESSRNKGGIEIGLTLNKPEMDAFSNTFAQALEYIISNQTSQ